MFPQLHCRLPEPTGPLVGMPHHRAWRASLQSSSCAVSPWVSTPGLGYVARLLPARSRHGHFSLFCGASWSHCFVVPRFGRRGYRPRYRLRPLCSPGQSHHALESSSAGAGGPSLGSTTTLDGSLALDLLVDMRPSRSGTMSALRGVSVSSHRCMRCSTVQVLGDGDPGPRVPDPSCGVDRRARYCWASS